MSDETERLANARARDWCAIIAAECQAMIDELTDLLEPPNRTRAPIARSPCDRSR